MFNLLGQLKNPEGRPASVLAQNTMWALGGYGIRLVVQAAYFVIIARCLGPAQYGGFIAVTAFASLISPFVGLGSGNLIIRNVARDKKLFAQSWGNGLFMTLLSGSILVVGTIALSLAVLPHTIPTLVMVFISGSDLIFVKLVEMAAWAFQAFEMLSKNAQLNVLISLSRLIGILTLALVATHPTVLEWAAVYFAGSVLVAIIAITWATLKLGKPRLALDRIKKESADGFCFSVSFSAQTFYNDIDKIMVARLATLEAAGVYGAAYRLIDVAFIPVRALLNAAYPGFFRSGQKGIAASMSYGRRLLSRILPYSLFAFAVLLVGAPVVPFVLGREYASVVEALRWLALLPLLKTLHYFVADSLTGAGYQGLRTCVQVSVAIFNVLINLWIIPAYGWRGAAWSSIASDGLLAGVLWLVAIRLSAEAAATCDRPAMVAVDSV